MRNSVETVLRSSKRRKNVHSNTYPSKVTVYEKLQSETYPPPLRRLLLNTRRVDNAKLREKRSTRTIVL